MGEQRRPEEIGRTEAAEASQQKQAAENLLQDFFPQAKAKEIEEKQPVVASNDSATEKKFEDMSPQEHLKVITAALENAVKLFNKLPDDWKTAVASANYESGTINPSDLADPKKIRGFLSTLEQRIT